MLDLLLRVVALGWGEGEVPRVLGQSTAGHHGKAQSSIAEGTGPGESTSTAF